MHLILTEVIFTTWKMHVQKLEKLETNNISHHLMSRQGNYARIDNPTSGESTSHRWLSRKSDSDVEPWCYIYC